MDVLERAVAAAGPDVVLVGHSTACALVAFWAAESKRAVRGALLVAPSDTESSHYPPDPTGWTPMPRATLPFASTVVTSTNDEYVTVERATEIANAWGSRLVIVSDAGHLNSASGIGDWPLGRRLLKELLGASAA